MARKSDTLTITGNFDGGNPKPASLVRRGNGKNVFTVIPTWEKPPPEIYGQAFAVQVRSAATRALPVTVRVDWTWPLHMQYKSYYYLNHGGDDEWRELEAAVDGAVATVSFDAEPGESCLSLSPMYNYGDSLAFADAMSERPDVETALAGKSRQGREIWLLRTPVTPAAGAEPVFFLCRNDACETSGNFMIEGMMRLLLSGEGEAKGLLKRFAFHFLPMSNPDGVHDGLERDTAAKNGAWLARFNTAADPAHDAIRKSLEVVRPAVFVNLHTWMMNDVDGLLCNEELYARRLAETLPQVGRAPHRRHCEWYSDAIQDVEEREGATVWPVSKLAELHEQSGGTWKDFCRERFGSRAMAVEFPWHGRSVEDMRVLGAALLKAVCAIRMSEGKAKT